VAIWFASTWINFFSDTPNIFGFSGYILVLIIAGLFFNERVGEFFFYLIILVNIGVLVVEVLGIGPFNAANDLVGHESLWIAQGILFFLIALLLRLAFRALQDALARAQVHERHLERRAMQIQTAAEVSRDATGVLELKQLLNRAVDLIHDRFGFYFAALYLVDERNEYAVLKAATGNIGKQLLEQGHKLRIGTEGMIGHVAGSGKPRMALDVGKDAVHFKNPLLPHTRSEMSLPLVAKLKVLGVLDVQSQIESAFTDEDVEVLQTVADQLAVAYETARLFEAAQRQLRELTVLHAVAVASTQTASEEALIERVTQIIGDAFYPDNFGVILVDERSGMLRKHPSYREKVEHEDILYPIGVGITGMVAKEGRSWRVGNVIEEPAYWAFDPVTQSELCVPVKMGDRVVGVLNTESTQMDAFTEADERLLATVAGHLALALENARLFDAERHLSSDLEALRQASLHLNSSLELEPVLETTLGEALQLVAADFSQIYLYDDSKLTDGLETYSSNSSEVSPPIVDLEKTAMAVAQTRQKMVVSNMTTDPSFSNQQMNGALICLPMGRAEQIVGVIAVYFFEPDAFDQNDLRVLELFADQAALALENARLYADIQKHTRELVQAFTRLQEMDRMKKEFIQNVSHEMRTPLAVVLGYAELLESGELGELKTEQSGPMSVIVRRLRGLSMMLEDFLVILEVEAGDQALELLDMAQLVKTVLAKVESSITQAKLNLQLDITPDLPEISGVSVHLCRVIENLLGNAIKFTPTGGSIRIQLSGDEKEIMLDISDTGIGIPDEQLPRIFERFYQVDGTSTRRYAGIGLGLALVKEVVQAYGGSVAAESRIGEGSTFTVTLPVADENA
jgi:K+-sensing histidine kinase KdpD